MVLSLRDALLRSGAVVNGASATALHFGSPDAELRAARRICVLADRSNLGRVLATGPDLLELLHRLSTADLASLGSGDGKPTVLTSTKGRIVERLFTHHLGDGGILLLCGPGASGKVIGHVARYTLRERTGLADVGDRTCLLAVVGPLAERALEVGGFERPGPLRCATTRFEGSPVRILGHDGLGGDGFCFLVPTDGAAALWQALVLAVSSCDGRPAGEQALEAYRVLRGLPADGHELTEAHNPLEAGLWDSVSFQKGCYVGQEVVARLNTYDKVSRSILGLELPRACAPPERGTPLYRADREVGRITSALLPPGWEHPVALAYVKRDTAAPGLEVMVGDPASAVVGKLVELPFNGW